MSTPTFKKRFEELVADGSSGEEAFRVATLEEARRMLAKPGTASRFPGPVWGIKAKDVRKRIEELRRADRGEEAEG